MKKIAIAIILALTLLLVVMGCKAQGENQADVQKEIVPVEETKPAETLEPEESISPVNQVEMSVQDVDTRRLPTDEELLKIFNTSYDFGKIFVNEGFSEEDVIEQELVELQCLIGMIDNVKAPDDLEDQYMAWRATHEGEVSAEVPTAQQSSGISGNDVSSSTINDSSLVDSSVDNSGALGGDSQPITGGLSTDVTGGMNPNDFMNIDDGTYAKDHAYIDPSKIIFGN